MHRAIALASFIVLLVLPSERTKRSHDSAPGLPWLRGLADARISDGSRYTKELPSTDPDCMITSDPVFEIIADVAPATGSETVLASITGGVAVFGKRGELLASLGGFACEGSADRIEALAAGRTFLDPMIAVIGTTGGRREQSTWISLIRPNAAGDALDATFTGIVEERVDRDGGREVQRGWVALLPGALLHHHPGGGTAIWQYDPVVRAYVPRGWIDRPETTLDHTTPVASIP